MEFVALFMPKIYIAASKKLVVIERAQGRCEYCQSRADYATETFAAEHIIPSSRGGSTELDNLALACSGCNGHKYNKLEAIDPVDGTMVQIFHPRQQYWIDHFGWREGFTKIIGLTATGRATVDVLQMNRPGLVNIRSVLYMIGKHPPDFSRA